MFILFHLDPRTADWFLISSPWPTVGLMIGYLAVVHFGQKVMASRKPFDLKVVMIIYNFLIVLLSIYMVKEVNYDFHKLVFFFNFM